MENLSEKSRIYLDGRAFSVMYGTFQVSEIVGVSQQTIRGWIRSGRLRAHRRVARLMVSRTDLIRFIEAMPEGRKSDDSGKQG